MVTGAGQGIGRATALAFATAGARVAVVDRDAELARATVREIETAGGRADALVCDVTSPAEVGRCVADIGKSLGPATILVNNAGGGNPPTSIMSPDEDWNAIFALNLMSVIYVTRAVWPGLCEQGGGVVLNAASQSARVADPNLAGYCAAKAAIVQLTRCLAVEGAPHGIRVNCVSPGFVSTPALTAWIGAEPDPVAVTEAIVNKIPLARLAQPDDIARTYVFLASDAAVYVTGAELPVDGGSTTQLA